MNDLSYERLRLNALNGLAILDTEPERVFDLLTRMAANLFQTSMCAISCIDADRQWFKSSVGLALSETDRKVAFCDYTIGCDEALVVPDALKDARFMNNPLVLAEPSIRFYAGVRITYAGYGIGAFCIFDNQPRRDFSAADLNMLCMFAELASSILDLRKDAWPSDLRCVYID